MQTANPSPALAEATGLLSGHLARRLRKTARLLAPFAAGLEAGYLRLLNHRGFNSDQTKALAAITPVAAARLIGQRKKVPDFVEQVEYSGRRLAKLDVAPAAVVDALAGFDTLLAREVRTWKPDDAAEVLSVAGQLSFCTVITLNNSFYQVREAETQAFFELHDAELHASNGQELIEAYRRVLAGYVRADASCAAVQGIGDGPLVASHRKLARPRLVNGGADAGTLLIDPSWDGRYRSIWSVPLGCGAFQFGFKKDYQWLPRELRLLTGASERCMSVLEKLRLTEQLANREQQIRQLALRMLEAEERERRRIGRELHDETAQLLPYLRLQLEMLERTQPEAPEAVKTGLAEARELIGRTVVEIRRVLSDLSPAVLEQLGLAAAVRHLLSQLRQMHGVEVRLDASRLTRVPKQIEVAAYRIIQECCNNVGRHSSASHLNVWLSTADGRLKMRIEDDGVGFRVEEALAKTGSYGLAGIQERIALAGGRFDLSSRPRHGTRISVEIPVPGPERIQRTRRRTGVERGALLTS